MRWHDPAAKLVLAGSSSMGMPTFPVWDYTVLDLAWEQVDYHSLHYYANNNDNDTGSFLALAAEFEAYLDSVSGVLRFVKAKHRSKHDVFLSWDEWNVWYKAHLSSDMEGRWSEAPHLIEEVYNLEDALVVAQWMNVFLRKSAVLKVACLAQVVNVIAPILTTREALLKQSIYYPFMLFSKLASGVALDVAVKAPLYSTARFGDMPLLDVSSSYDETTHAHAIFIVNRSQTDSLPVDLCWQDRAPQSISAVYQVAGKDPKAANSYEQPDLITAVKVAAPAIKDRHALLTVPPLSFTAIEAPLA